MKRKGVTIKRTTKETSVTITLGASAGELSVCTPVPMFTHLLEQLGFYWGAGLRVRAEEFTPLGDGHHLAEDTALALGQALDQWLGDRASIQRYAQRWLPMDDALALAVLDAGGRAFFAGEIPLNGAYLGGLALENVAHFFRSLCAEGRLTLHVRLSGENAHHLAEALFKAVGMALAEATQPWAGGVRSTKGVPS